MTAPLDRPLVAALNHLLAQSDWARHRLHAHAGKTARVRLAGLDLRLAVEPGGRLAPGDAAAAVDLTLEVPLAAAVALRAGDARARREVRVSGDAGFAADLAYVAGHLDWDGEADLARLVGDIAARRIAGVARALAAAPAQAATTLARSTGRFVAAERSLAPDRGQMDTWADAVDRLRDDVERLAARIDRLEASSRPR